jgi:hypothetical protein
MELHGLDALWSGRAHVHSGFIGGNDIVKSSVFSLLAVNLAGLMPAALWAQEPAVPAKADGPAPANQDAAPTPTLESLQADVQKLKAQHQEDLRQLREEQAQREADALVDFQQTAAERERLLRIYGFADIGAKHISKSGNAYYDAQMPSPFTFFLGRLNLYFDSQPDPDFRFLAETRFTLYPNGNLGVNSNTGEVIRTSTATSDTSGPNPYASVKWGGVILERVTLDWKRYDFFSVRVGMFLSPFGIYNVDHGTPTLISLLQPNYISAAWIPERQLGVQIFGSAFIDNWELGYAATAANGRSDGNFDIDDSKGFGGRLLVKRKGELRLQLGASGIYQPYRRDHEQFGLGADGQPTYQQTRVVDAKYLTVGADLSLDYRGLRIRSEFIYHKRDYSSGKHEPSLMTPGAYAPDLRGSDLFLVIAHRWWKLEPFVHSELFLIAPINTENPKTFVGVLGLNLYLRSNVILKGSWAAVRFLRGGAAEGTPIPGSMQSWDLLLTWAF